MVQQYTVTGMSCAACSARIEKAVGALPGVESVAVNLLTGAMRVEGDAPAREVITAVQKAGYGAALASSGKGSRGEATAAPLGEDPLRDRETPALLRRLLFSVALTLPLLYLSMGHAMWGWPLPPFLGNPLAVGLTELLLTVAVMIVNRRFFVSGAKSLWHFSPNMDALVSLGAGAAFVYSVALLFGMCDDAARGDMAAAMEGLHGLYFESAAMILTLITVGKTLEAHAKGKTTSALRSLLRLAPPTARVLRGGEEVSVPAEEVRCGERFSLRPGESIPLDGVVLEGSGAVDESALTGESIPTEKQPGARVYAGTINREGYLLCEVTGEAGDTALAQIIRTVNEASSTKAPIASLADKVSGVFVPAVMVIALVTTVVWLILGRGVGFALSHGICVLVISCPCALGLATPVAIMVGSGVGARGGIFFKTAAALEGCAKVKTILLDKTGTITEGKPVVTVIAPAVGVRERELLTLAASLEEKSEHPLARAVAARAREEGIEALPVENFRSLPGCGVEGTRSGEALCGGSLRYVSSRADLPDELAPAIERISADGGTPLLFARGVALGEGEAARGRVAGVIGVSDRLREDSADAIREMRGMGLRTVMLTGDRAASARAVAAAAGVDEVEAELLPGGKQQAVRERQASGPVAMVGDGINDAPALTAADIGIAIGAGTDVAIDAANVVLMKNTLADAAAAVRLSRATLRNIKENLFWAFIYNALGIPLAAGVFGLTLSPMFAAAAMSLSSFFVVTNALRLNLFKLHKGKGRKSAGAQSGGESGERAAGEASFTIEKTSENPGMPGGTTDLSRKETTMETRTLKIEGMMCENCERHVKSALEAVPGVRSADVSRARGDAVITLENHVDDALLRAAVKGEGYEVK